MAYGGGGAGKTTLFIDLACHLAAGDDWLGLTVAKPLRVLLIENEGPRPFFREKLERKLAGWTGSPLAGRLRVLEEPWAQVSFNDEAHREALAHAIAEGELDVVVIGPVTRIGMDEAGTLQHVRDFQQLLTDARRRCGRPVTFALVHHENRAGNVSGLWEPAVETLIHLQAQGHGRTRLHFEKARWASEYHKTSLQLVWGDGESFTVDDAPELDDDAIAELILDAVRENPGTGWTRVETAIRGVGNERIRSVRDGLLAAGGLLNVVKRQGVQVALTTCPERQAAHLYPPDDPTIAHLRREPGAAVAQSAPAQVAEPNAPAPCAAPIGRTGVGADEAPPAEGL